MTATAKPIDWTKPVQASQRDFAWCNVRVLCVDLRGFRDVVLAIDVGEAESVVVVSSDGSNAYGWQFRNTPAPPVPFEFTYAWSNVYRREDGTFYSGCMYTSEDNARRCGETMRPFVTVPVTIKGEWKECESCS